jgi:hypothetical protein
MLNAPGDRVVEMSALTGLSFRSEKGQAPRRTRTSRRRLAAINVARNTKVLLELDAPIASTITPDVERCCGSNSCSGVRYRIAAAAGDFP